MDALDESDNKVKRIDVYIDITSDLYAVVNIRDNGGGISDEIKSRIFEPYFTTKDNNKGVGIGLYMSKQIVENMNGEMWFDDIEGGTSFNIKLKVSPTYLSSLQK